MGYLGIELDELICLLSRGHEAVFSLNGNQYIIQPVQSDSLYGDLVMYQFKPHLVWLCRIPISPDHSIDKAPFIRWPVWFSLEGQPAPKDGYMHCHISIFCYTFISICINTRNLANKGTSI